MYINRNVGGVGVVQTNPGLRASPVCFPGSGPERPVEEAPLRALDVVHRGEEVFP